MKKVLTKKEVDKIFKELDKYPDEIEKIQREHNKKIIDIIRR